LKNAFHLQLVIIHLVMTCTVILTNCKTFYCFSPWEKAALCFECILNSILHKKTANELLIGPYTLLHAIASSYVCGHAAITKITTTLKCLASGKYKKSIETLWPTVPW